MTRPPGSSREAKKDPSERGRGVFCKNCPFSSRALPIHEKTFLPVWPEGPRRCLKDSESLPVKMGNNSSHQNDKKNNRGHGVSGQDTPCPLFASFRSITLEIQAPPRDQRRPAARGYPQRYRTPSSSPIKRVGRGKGGLLCASQRPNGGPLGPCPLRRRKLRASTAEIGSPLPPQEHLTSPPALLTSCRRRRAANMPSSQGWSWGVCHCTRRSRLLSSASSQSTACSFSSGCRVQVM